MEIWLDSSFLAPPEKDGIVHAFVPHDRQPPRYVPLAALLPRNTSSTSPLWDRCARVFVPWRDWEFICRCRFARRSVPTAIFIREWWRKNGLRRMWRRCARRFEGIENY